MRRILLLPLALLLPAGLIAPSVAHAVLMRVDFSVLADPGDATHAGQTASGYFTFDSSIAPVGGGTLGAGNLSGLSFTWTGDAWTTANADAFNLNFNAGGTLTGWGLGGAPNGFAGVVAPGPDDFTMISGFSSFAYSYNNTLFSGGTMTSWSVAPASAAAEPGTLALLIPGLLPLGMMLRRRRKA